MVGPPDPYALLLTLGCLGSEIRDEFEQPVLLTVRVLKNTCFGCIVSVLKGGLEP